MAPAEVESTMIAAVDVERIQFMPKSQDDMLKPLEEFNKDREKFAELKKAKEAPISRTPI